MCPKITNLNQNNQMIQRAHIDLMIVKLSLCMYIWDRISTFHFNICIKQLSNNHPWWLKIEQSTNLVIFYGVTPQSGTCQGKNHGISDIIRADIGSCIQCTVKKTDI